jgi:O-succinylbenzoate synthase
MLTIDAVHLREINMPLAFPFETSFGRTTTRRILLVEIESGGLTAWGECVAGEHPYFSDECIDTAWIVTEKELAPRLVGKELVSGGSCPELFRQVRGHRMAKAALENAGASGEAAGWYAQRDSVRRLDRNSAVARGADGEDWAGT